jgi:hypothetical protein
MEARGGAVEARGGAATEVVVLEEGRGGPEDGMDEKKELSEETVELKNEEGAGPMEAIGGPWPVGGGMK